MIANTVGPSAPFMWLHATLRPAHASDEHATDLR